MNEFAMKTILTILDGKTSGPNLFAGPVGSLLRKCTELPPVCLPLVNLPPEYLSDPLSNDDLSSDQLYLRSIIIGASTGDICESLSKRTPGKLGYTAL